MKELQEILQKIDGFAPDEKAILATVVDVKGSSYRLAGAKMLIDADGNSIGTVSGGCLEADVLERAKKVLQTGESTIIIYDTTKNEDSVFGFGMGCRGIVKILLEKTENNKYVNFLRECVGNRKSGAVATLISKPEDFIFPIGMKIYVHAEKESFEHPNIDTDNDSFLQCVISEANHAIELNRSQSYVCDVENGQVEFFIEVVNPPVSLLIFGGGYDAIPLADFGKSLGWQVSIIDHRPAWANSDRFPSVDEIIVERAENLDKNLFEDENSVAVIMTHNYENDAKLLPRLMDSKCLYIGALGPKKRTEKILEESGQVYDSEQLTKLYAPIGLDIGAETPEEIALAIISEIKTALAKRKGGFLRERSGGIH